MESYVLEGYKAYVLHVVFGLISGTTWFPALLSG